MSTGKRIFLMLLLTCMWSPSFLFIKLAVQDLPPLTIVSLRVSIAAFILCAILGWYRRKLPIDISFWMRTTIMALFSSMFPFCLFCYAEKSIDSAMAAILNGTTLMFTSVLAQLFVTSDRMNVQKSLGIVICSAGVIWLFTPQLLEGMDATALGMSAAVMAAFSYAVSHVYGKLYITGQPPFVAPTAQLLISSVFMWPIAIWHDEIGSLNMPSIAAMSGVGGLALFGTIFAFIIYYKLLEHCGPTAISMVSCFFPVGGMLLGFIFLDETFTTSSMLASGTILVGMLLVNEVVSFGWMNKKVEMIRDNTEEEGN